MSHYRSIMATTIDCEGCQFDSEKECLRDYCILLDNFADVSTNEPNEISVAEAEKKVLNLSKKLVF